jgi:hypothetical protein
MVRSFRLAPQLFCHPVALDHTEGPSLCGGLAALFDRGCALTPAHSPWPLSISGVGSVYIWTTLRGVNKVCFTDLCETRSERGPLMDFRLRLRRPPDHWRLAK